MVYPSTYRRAIRRPLSEIAEDIEASWDGITPEAELWLTAMATLDRPSDAYYENNGYDVVKHFLGASKTWFGPEATELKAELRRLITR